MNRIPEKLSKEKIEGIRKQAHKNIRLILKKFNFEGDDYGNRIVGCCPIPHRDSNSPNDNRKAFSWDFDRQMWQCFTHRCHTVFGSDIFALVRSVKRCSFIDSVKWILGAIEQDFDEVKELNSQEVEKIQHVIRKKSELVKHAQQEESIMKHLKKSMYFTNRGFSNECLNEFNAWGEWHKAKTYGENRAIIPVYDPIDGHLIAFTCRILNDELIESWRPKWLHCLNFAALRKKSSERTDEERFHASSVLFNLHRAKQHMGHDKTIILVEGPVDVMRMWEAGYKNCVAVLGTGFCKHHRTLLHKVGCNRIIIALDGDEAGQKATSGVRRLCDNYFNVDVVNLPNNKDPGDMDPGQLRLLFKEYVND